MKQSKLSTAYRLNDQLVELPVYGHDYFSGMEACITNTGIPILWQDDDLLAVSKPSGLLSLPDGYDSAKPHLRAVLEPVYGRLWIVHRLDRLTSGVMLLARNTAAHKLLNDQFANHEVTKRYHALVAGVPDWQELTVDQPLRANVGRRKRTVVDLQRGKPAKTHLRVLRRYQGSCLLETRPETGRTHQIRAHLTVVGYPVIGDPLYFIQVDGKAVMSDLLDDGSQRLMLHASQLALRHPSSGQPILLEAPYPPDFILPSFSLHRFDFPGGWTGFCKKRFRWDDL